MFSRCSMKKIWVFPDLQNYTFRPTFFHSESQIRQDDLFSINKGVVGYCLEELRGKTQKKSFQHFVPDQCLDRRTCIAA